MDNSLSIKNKSQFSVFDSALAVTLFILFNFIFLLLYGAVPANIRENKVVYFIASFLIEALFAVVALVIALTRKINIKEAAGLNKKVSGKMVGLAFLISLVCLIGFSDLTSVFLDFLSLCGYKSILGDLGLNSFGEYFGYVIVSCITPAICEELLFRGVILSGFKKYGTKIAVVVSALIFMLMHGNAEQTVHQFIIGLVVGYIFIMSGNLWIGVLVHFFNNFISITEAYILNMVAQQLISEGALEGVAEPAAQITVLSLITSLIVALIIAFIAYIIIKALIKSLLKENDRVNGTTQEVSTNATIVVDGEETNVSMTIEGENLERETLIDGENLSSKKTEEKSGFTIASIVMFAISGAYLVVDWILALLKGFGI